MDLRESTSQVKNMLPEIGHIGFQHRVMEFLVVVCQCALIGIFQDDIMGLLLCEASIELDNGLARFFV